MWEKSPQKTIMDSSNKVEFPGLSDSDKTGDWEGGKTFYHSVGDIEVKIIDDVGTRGFNLVTLSNKKFSLFEIELASFKISIFLKQSFLF